MRIAFTGITHRGLVRRENEDTIGAAGWIGSGDMPAAEHRSIDIRSPVCCVVADGMGGHDAGAMASRFAVSRLVRAQSGLTSNEALEDILGAMDRDLTRMAGEQGLVRGAGTTVAGIVLTADGAVRVFNVGDSRVYHQARKAAPFRVSVDDTAGNDADGRTGTRGHVITQAIGGKLTPTRLKPHFRRIPAGIGDRFLLCSDGLTDVLSDTCIAQLLEDSDERSVEALLAAAMEGGGPDNISVCLVSVGGA